MDIIKLILEPIIFVNIILTILFYRETIKCQHKLKDLGVERYDVIQSIKGDDLKIKTTLYCKKCNKSFEEVNTFDTTEYNNYLKSLEDNMYLLDKPTPRN